MTRSGLLECLAAPRALEDAAAPAGQTGPSARILLVCRDGNKTKKNTFFFYLVDFALVVSVMVVLVMVIFTIVIFAFVVVFAVVVVVVPD